MAFNSNPESVLQYICSQTSLELTDPPVKWGESEIFMGREHCQLSTFPLPPVPTWEQGAVWIAPASTLSMYQHWLLS